MRKPCFDCCLKHLGTALAVDGLWLGDHRSPVPFRSSSDHSTAFLYLSKALVLRDECYQGYPEHENYVRGYLSLASHVLLTADPELSDNIRLFRLGLQDGIGGWDSGEMEKLLHRCTAVVGMDSTMGLAYVIGNISEAADEIAGYMPELASVLADIVKELMAKPDADIRGRITEACTACQAASSLSKLSSKDEEALP